MEHTLQDQSTDLKRLISDLKDCQKLSKETPLINAYQQLSYRLLHRVNSDNFSNEEIGNLISELWGSGFLCRAERAKRYLQEVDVDRNKKGLKQVIERLASNCDFDDFQKIVGRQLAGIVITGHPTFGFHASQYDVLAKVIEGSFTNEEAIKKLSECPARPDLGLTLEDEFIRSQDALLNLEGAIVELYRLVLDVAREKYPDEWRNLEIELVTAASWVGFDVDGRDDITWMDSVKFRFLMAVQQCDFYLKYWQKISNDDVTNSILQNLKDYFERGLDHIPNDIDDMDEVRKFARWAVDHQNALEACSDLQGEIEGLIAKADNEDMADLLIFRSLFSNFQTGFSHIHFRLNSVQLHNAIRPMIAMEKDPDDATSRRRYMNAASKLIDHIEKQTAGYETIMHEQTTAKRLFMIMGQFFKYIDPNTPIRFLIAESETPFTVMAALCYAKLFDIDDKVDISPLFETDQALMRGSEIIEELLENPHYMAYVKKRGRLCIQAGYSDAGRYLGQVAAGLAIERLRIKVIKLWQKFDLQDVELVIFDTGGESLGRGAHPNGFGGRLDYKHPPEARRLVAELNVPYKQEFSLQGGDGYLWLNTPKLAFATLCRVMENMLEQREYPEDPFYKNTDWSLDFFLTAKNYSTHLSSNPDYMKLLMTLGTDISFPTGSRMTVRQDEGVLSRPLEKLSQIRAIPNNMLLHQIGYLANSLGGVGTAISQDENGFWKMYEKSDRLRHIMVMVFASLDVTEEDFLGAYTSLLRPRYWMHAARYEDESHNHDRMLRLAKMLEKTKIFEGLNRIELTLREDLMFLRDNIKDEQTVKPIFQLNEADKDNYTLLHVLRMVLVQKIFILVTRIPRFRDHKGLSVDDLVLRILRFQIPPTLVLLKEIFPLEGAYEIDPDNPEKITFLSDDAQGYVYENEQIFEQIDIAYTQIRTISMAISAFIGAIG